MSESEERLKREAEEPIWGVVCYSSRLVTGGTFRVVQDTGIYQGDRWLKASGLTYEEAIAMCTLMSAG